MKSPSDILGINYFFVIDLSLRILKIYEYISFDEQKFILMKSELSYFPLWFMLFVFSFNMQFENPVTT